MFGLRRQSQQVRVSDLVKRYGALLENCDAGFGGSRPAKELPAEKELMKAALLIESRRPGQSDEYLGALGLAFQELATFRENGGGATIINDPSISFGVAGPKGVTELALMKDILAETTSLHMEWQSSCGGANA